MQVRLINNNNQSVLRACEAFVQDNYLENLVLIGDLNSPCIDLTRIFGVYNNSKLQTFFVIFDGFQLPSVVLPSNLNETEFSTICKELQHLLPGDFLALTLTYSEDDYKKFFKVLHCSIDHCMILDSTTKLSSETIPQLQKASPKDLQRVNAFYTKIDARPWSKIQFKSNFYYYVEIEDEIIACGGTHFETPLLAQLGNIYVLNDHRRKGYGKAITSAISADVLSKKKYSTLFVAEDNAPAQALYNKLGYKFFRKAKLIFCSNSKNKSVKGEMKFEKYQF